MKKDEEEEEEGHPACSTPGWAFETMMMINKLTPDIKGKAFDPDWFLLRQRLEAAERVMNTELHLFGGWVDARKTLPKEDGHYIIHAPSANPKKPFVTMAWYNPVSGWSLLPECWRNAITYWMPKPKPPNID